LSDRLCGRHFVSLLDYIILFLETRQGAKVSDQAKGWLRGKRGQDTSLGAMTRPTISPVFKETVFKEIGLLLRRRLSISNVSLSSNENYSYLDPTDF
jgi:hypothetical protein